MANLDFNKNEYKLSTTINNENCNKCINDNDCVNFKRKEYAK